MSATATATQDKPSAAPLMMGESEPPKLTHADFMHHMTAMKAHYKAANSNGGIGPTHAYALPVHLMFAPPDAESSPAEAASSPTGAAFAASAAVRRPSQGKAEVDAALSASKAGTTAFAEHQKRAVEAATKKLQGDHDTSDFAAKMNAQKQKAKEESDRRIDETFNKLIEIGTKHPEQQHRILSVTQQIGAFFTSLLANIAGFFLDIYRKIVGWINSAADWVKGAAAAVNDWIHGAVNKITHFFAGL
jgi:hypothetical protein